jgi:hypothetical protein
MSKKSHNNQGSISKNPSSNLSVKVTNSDTSSSGSNSSSSEEDKGETGLLPPLHPHSRPANVIISDDNNEVMSATRRSFSMADLQGMVGSSSLISGRDGQKRRFYWVRKIMFSDCVSATLSIFLVSWNQVAELWLHVIEVYYN